MTISIHIDPTQVVDSTAVFALIDKDYVDYIKVIDVIIALEKYERCLKKLCAEQLCKQLKTMPPEEVTPDFMDKIDDITMSQIFPLPTNPKEN